MSAHESMEPRYHHRRSHNKDKGENNPFILLELSGCVHRGDSLFVGVGKFLHDVLLVFLLQYRNLRISHSYRKSERTLTQRRAKYRVRETMREKKAFQNSGNLSRRAEKGKHFTEIEMKTSWFSVFLTAHEKCTEKLRGKLYSVLPFSTIPFPE